MILEQHKGPFGIYPFYQANNLADMIKSREEIVRSLNPEYKSYKENPWHLEDNRFYGDPRYFNEIYALVSGVNYDGLIESSKYTNLYRLYDNTGEVFVSLPSRIQQFIGKLVRKDKYPDFNLVKSSIWEDKTVVICNTYAYTINDLNPRRTTYSLVDIDKLTELETKPVSEILPHSLILSPKI